MGMGRNGNRLHGNGREWECKKPFPGISTQKFTKMRHSSPKVPSQDIMKRERPRVIVFYSSNSHTLCALKLYQSKVKQLILLHCSFIAVYYANHSAEIERSIGG